MPLMGNSVIFRSRSRNGFDQSSPANASRGIPARVNLARRRMKIENRLPADSADGRR